MLHWLKTCKSESQASKCNLQQSQTLRIWSNYSGNYSQILITNFKYSHKHVFDSIASFSSPQQLLLLLLLAMGVFRFCFFFFSLSQGLTIYSARWTEAFHIEQDSLKLTEIHLPLSPEYQDQRDAPPYPGLQCLFIVKCIHSTC